MLSRPLDVTQIALPRASGSGLIDAGDLAAGADLSTVKTLQPEKHGALMADSGAAMIGAAVGTSTTTSYIESASGINAGGRIGDSAVTRSGNGSPACS